jgi:hypothetical protein
MSEGAFSELDYVKLNQNSDFTYIMLVSATDLTLFGDHSISLFYTLNRYGSI